MANQFQISANVSRHQTERNTYLLCVGCALLVAGAYYLGFGPLVRQELSSYDLRFHLRGTEPPAPEIILLSIDKSSHVLDSFTQEQLMREADELALCANPSLHRRVYAAAIQRLCAAGAKVIAFDVPFFEKTIADEDRRLREAVETNVQRVVLASEVTLEGKEKSIRNPERFVPETNEPAIDSKTMKSVAGFTGLDRTDVDGFIRKIKFRIDDFTARPGDENPFWFSFSALAALHSNPQVLLPPPGKSANINFPGPPGTFPTHPLYEIFYSKTWQQNFKKGNAFKDKVVLIGPTEGPENRHRTPFSEAAEMPTLEIHAAAIATLLQNNAPRGAPTWTCGVMVLLVALLSGAMLNMRLRLVTRFVLLTGLATVSLGVASLAFAQLRWVIPAVPPVWTIAAGGVVGAAMQMLMARRDIATKDKTISIYTSREIVRVIIEQRKRYEDSVSAGGELAKAPHHQVITIESGEVEIETVLWNPHPHTIDAYHVRSANAREGAGLTLWLFPGDEPLFKGIHRQKAAFDGGARNLVPIHVLHDDPATSWYVTDSYPNATLEQHIENRLSAAVIRHLLSHILRGLRDLKKTTDCSHGNLQASKIVIGGSARLRDAEVFLYEPQPGDASKAAEYERSDLYAIGDLIYQLVLCNNRLSGRSDWPIQESDEWHRLGRRLGKAWFALCYNLLNPNFPPDKIDFPWLEEELRKLSWLRLQTVAACVAAGLLVIGLCFLIFKPPTLGFVRIDSEPSQGVELFHGGKRLGLAPQTIQLPAGRQELIARHDLLGEQQLSLMVKKNKETNLVVTFPYGGAKIESVPLGATVMEGGKSIGRTPLRLPVLRTGEVRLAFLLDGYLPANATIEVTNRAELKISVKLTPTTMTNSISMKLVWVPGIAEGTRGCWVGIYEVTQEEYEKVTKQNPSEFAPTNGIFRERQIRWNKRLPVEHVSWNDAMAFCKQLTARDTRDLSNFPKGAQYSLPTEQQWRLLADDADLRDAVTSLGQPERNRRILPEAVGSLRPNRFGLYDVRGNVMEWCISEGRDPVQGDVGTIRGGDFRGFSDLGPSNSLNINFLVRRDKTNRYDKTGFRVILQPPLLPR